MSPVRRPQAGLHRSSPSLVRRLALALVTAALTPAAAGCANGYVDDTRAEARRTDGGHRSPHVDGGVATDSDGATTLPDGATVTPPPTPEPPAALGLAVTSVTSDTIAVRWDRVAGATRVRVLVAPEPVAEQGRPLPMELEVASLAGDATSYVVTGIAPNIDAFVRIEAQLDGGALAGAHVHARTLGGPRGSLTSAVRSVEGFAPNVLRVVLTGGDGAGWQSGTWRVTRGDGRSIAVTRVHRHSLPVSAPSYDIGWGLPYDDSIVVVDHALYLVLAEPVGAMDMLRIEGPSGVSFLLPFSDHYLETPVIQLNQVGYNPRAHQRWAYVYGWMGDGGALALGSFPASAEMIVDNPDPKQPRSARMTSLAVTTRSAVDVDSGAEVRQIDLSGVPADETARYRVRLPGVGVSFATAVSERAALKSFYAVARGLFHNRWGGDLRPDLTEWTRPADHPTVYTAEQADFTEFFPETTPRTGERSLRGGYHDAGDFDQRPMHTVVAQLLMRAFEVNSMAFADRQLTIPESGNGIPDLLDEALWGVAGWAALQESDGGVRMGVESTRHPWGFYLANDDPLVYFTFARNAQVTARAAGLFAQASRLVAPYDATRAAELRGRALSAWSYATSHGAKPAYTMYAAGELFRLTGDASYARAFESAWSAMGAYGAFSNFASAHLSMGDYIEDMDPSSGTRAMPDFILGYLNAPGASASIVSSSDFGLRHSADEALGVMATEHAHRNPRPPGYALTWGQGTMAARYVDCAIAMLAFPGVDSASRQRYFDALSVAADYMLGANPEGLVFITGLGSRRIEEPLHLDSLVWAKRGLGPVPGIPVYGLTDSIWQPWSEPAKAQFYPAPFEEYPQGRRYGDVRTFIVTNEFTVWETQAPLAELFAVLLGPGAMMPPDRWLPGGTEHHATLP